MASGAQIFQVQQQPLQTIPPKKANRVLSVLSMLGSTIGIGLFLYAVEEEGGFEGTVIAFDVMTFLWILGIALVSAILTVVATFKPIPSLGLSITALVFVCLNFTIATVLLILTIFALSSCSSNYFEDDCLIYGLLVGGIIFIWICQIANIVICSLEIRRSSPGTTIPQMLYLVNGNSAQPQAVALNTISSTSAPIPPSYTIAAPESDSDNAPLILKN